MSGCRIIRRDPILVAVIFQWRFFSVFDGLYFELGIEPFAVGMGAVAVGVDGGFGCRVSGCFVGV
jgi:hypothetical protein